MKKAIFKGFAVAALALAVLFTGCNNGQSNIEEVKVDAVEITAKAYPGYNYVTWGKSADANGSSITVYRDDGKVCTPITGRLAYVDTDIKDGVTYKYTAYVTNGKTVATPYGNQNLNLGDTEAKNGYVKIDAVSSDSCKAINPICIKDGKLMTALELCDFEDKGDEDFVINPENIVLELNANGTYDVAFPTKQYLSYETKVYHGNAYELFGRNNVVAADITTKSQAAAKEFYTNDSAVRYNAPVSGAGEYTVEVKVSAINESYTPSYVKAAKTFTIEKLDVATATGTPAAGYVKDNKTIRVVWTPAKKADASDWDVANYKVYVKNTVTSVYTEVAPAKAVTVDEEGNKTEGDAKLAIAAGAKNGDVVYYIDYPVENNKVAYAFTVVLADNGKVESTAKTASVDAYALGTLTWDDTNKQIKNGNNSLATLSTTFYDVEKNGNADDAILTFSSIDKNLVINSVKYVTIKGNDVAQYKYEDLLLDSEFTTSAKLPADYTKKDFVAANVGAANKVVFLVSANYTSATKEYKDLLFTIATSAQAPSATLSAAEYDVAESANSTAATPKYNVTLIPGTFDNKENYTYSAFWAKLDENTASAADVTSWTAVTGITIAKDGSVWKGSAEVPLTPTTTYSKDVDGKVTAVRDTFVFKIEKTLKAAASDPNAKAVAYQTVIVTATK